MFDQINLGINSVRKIEVKGGKGNQTITTFGEWVRQVESEVLIPEIFSNIINQELNPQETNCRNCGAPISYSGVCEYCNTNYRRKKD
jgi:hypothetical protein